jgi:predicted N-acyltransferase
MGEFVFDHSWADAAYRAGLSYYPKLLIGVPFTPAAGIRFLTAPNRDRPALIQTLGDTLKDLCAKSKLSSVHVNFCLEDEAKALAEVGYLQRFGMQYHWQNLGYNSFDDYLAQFRSKRRNQIKRELKEMSGQDLEIHALVGEEIPDELFPTMFRLYKATIDSLYWGHQYLRLKFFQLLASRFKRNLCFVIARQRGKIISGTFNVQKSGVFYGRYWGTFKELRHMHFNVCYYAAIEHCIKHKIVRFEPGAGGDFKRLRGFDPQPTLSMHYFVDTRLANGVARYLKSERQQIHRAIGWLQEESQLKPSAK